MARLEIDLMNGNPARRLIGCVRSGTSLVVTQMVKSWQVKLNYENNPAAMPLL